MSAFIIKIIACVCMLSDHIGAIFPVPFWFRVVGRAAFPIYAFFIAYGCKKTGNIDKYLVRLGLFALISEVPFDLAFMDSVNFFGETNVFYTLFLGAASIKIYELLRKKRRFWIPLLTAVPLPFVMLLIFAPEAVQEYIEVVARILFWLYVVGAFLFAKYLKDDEREITPRGAALRNFAAVAAVLPVMVCAGAFSSDYGFFGAAFIFAIYLCNPENRATRAVIMAAWVYSEYGTYLFKYINDDTGFRRVLDLFGLNSPYFWCALASVVAVLLYNGRRGIDLGRRGAKIVQWGFYAFYPAHIAVLVIIRAFI